MASHKTAEEAKAERIRLMGDRLGPVYDALWQQVAWVHEKWNEYVVLFGTKESRIILLNKVAPSFCSLVQDSLWENVLLHIARLTDSASTGRKLNLTIQSLPPLIDRPEIKGLLAEKIESALLASAFARDWRNPRLAHSDLQLNISDNATPLEFASRQCVNKALLALSDLLNVVSTAHLDSETCFDGLDGDALALLYVLDDGLRTDELRREQLKKGIYDPEQFKPRDL